MQQKAMDEKVLIAEGGDDEKQFLSQQYVLLQNYNYKNDSAVVKKLTEFSNPAMF
jgi:hypothetical protein